MDEGDNEAENILRSVVNVIKILIIIFSAIIGLVGVIGGCIMLSQNGAGFFVILAGIIIALIGYFFAKLVWAVGMIFINISTNVRTIKKQLQNRG